MPLYVEKFAKSLLAAYMWFGLVGSTAIDVSLWAPVLLVMLRLRPTLSTPLECPGTLSHPLNGTVLWAASGTLTAGAAAHTTDAAWPAPAVQVMANSATEAIPRRTTLLFLIR